MVTQSRVDYDQWKKEVYQIYSKYGDKIAAKFIEFISSRYDKFNRAYLPHQIMWRLFDLHNKVVYRNQHQVYGSFGRGGYGKSSLLKNVLYFHDPTFNQTRIASTIEGLSGVLYNILNMGNDGKYKAILIDEPSNEQHTQSKEWRITEDVLGQIRQNNLIIGIAATQLTNVKSGLYNLITGLFAFRRLYVYDYYDEEKVEGITGLIRRKYAQSGTYECFNNPEIIQKSYFKNTHSYKFTPIDSEQDDYEFEKKKAFLIKFRKLYAMRQGATEDVKRLQRNTQICELIKTGKVTQKAVAAKFKLSAVHVSSIWNRYHQQTNKV